MVPATLLGRLAVSSAFRGQGHGATLLMDALYRILQHSREVASAGVIVAAKDAAAFAFYTKYDFSNSQESSDGSSCRWAPWKSYFDRADRTLLVNLRGFWVVARLLDKGPRMDERQQTRCRSLLSHRVCHLS